MTRLTVRPSNKAVLATLLIGLSAPLARAQIPGELLIALKL